jgi:hypothetical protein
MEIRKIPDSTDKEPKSSVEIKKMPKTTDKNAAGLSSGLSLGLYAPSPGDKVEEDRDSDALRGEHMPERTEE